MNILDKIIEHKHEELEVRKSMVSELELTQSAYFDRPCLSLAQSLLAPGATGIIAEFKRKSPSKGYINQHALRGQPYLFGLFGLFAGRPHLFCQSPFFLFIR